MISHRVPHTEPWELTLKVWLERDGVKVEEHLLASGTGPALPAPERQDCGEIDVKSAGGGGAATRGGVSGPGRRIMEERVVVVEDDRVSIESLVCLLGVGVGGRLVSGQSAIPSKPTCPLPYHHRIYP